MIAMGRGVQLYVAFTRCWGQGGRVGNRTHQEHEGPGGFDAVADGVTWEWPGLGWYGWD